LTSAKPPSWIGEVPAPTEVPRLVRPKSPPADDTLLSLERSAVFVLLDIDGRHTVREIARQYGLLRGLRALSRLREEGLVSFEPGAPSPSAPPNGPSAGAGAGSPQSPAPPPPAGPRPTPPIQHAPSEPPQAGESWRDRLGRRGASLLQSEVFQAVVVTGALVIGIRTVVENFRVEGVSMQPTFDGGQVLVVNRAVYFHVDDGPLAHVLPSTNQGSAQYVFGGPQRGDIAVFRAPPQPDTDYIKRIIGLPGDHILIRDGQVFVNGERLAEPYIRFPASYSFPSNGQPLVVPDRNYFVLGDNRPESFDSHLGWVVPVDDLIGRAWIRYWPPNALAVLPPGEPALAQVAASSGEARR
jgi:signal peptidase I